MCCWWPWFPLSCPGMIGMGQSDCSFFLIWISQDWLDHLSWFFIWCCKTTRKSMKAVLMTVVPLSLLFCYFVTLLFLIVSEIVRFDFHLMFFLVFYCFHFSLLFFSFYFLFLLCCKTKRGMQLKSSWSLMCPRLVHAWKVWTNHIARSFKFELILTKFLKLNCPVFTLSASC